MVFLFPQTVSRPSMLLNACSCRADSLVAVSLEPVTSLPSLARFGVPERIQSRLLGLLVSGLHRAITPTRQATTGRSRMQAMNALYALTISLSSFRCVASRKRPTDPAASLEVRRLLMPRRCGSSARCVVLPWFANRYLLWTNAGSQRRVMHSGRCRPWIRSGSWSRFSLWCQRAS